MHGDIARLVSAAATSVALTALAIRIIRSNHRRKEQPA